MLLRRLQAMPPSFVLVTALGGLVPVLSSAASPDAAATRVEAVADPVLLQTKLVRKGRTLQHPGHMATPGEAVILTFTEGDTEHAVEVLLEQAKGGYTAEVVYRVGGKEILSGSTKAKKKKWAKVSGKGVSIAIRVDPEAKRPGELELPDGEDPLDGAK